MSIKINGTTVIDNSRNLTSIEAATFTGTGYVKVPSGTDAQRPGSPSNGMFRYNTTSNTFEGYVSGAWVQILHTGNITPTHIPEDTTHRWATDAEKTNWNAAYTHSQAAHAPSTAQKNSDITKAEIEAKLTGTISTHSHAAGNADTVDGFHAQKTAAVDKIPVAGAGGKLDAGWINAPNSPSGAQLFTASGTFTVPDGVTAVNVVVQGGGGAGGGATNSGSSGGTSSFGSYISATGGAGGLGAQPAAQPAGGVAANGGPSGGYVNRVDGWYNGGPFSNGADWIYNSSVTNNGGRASDHGPGGNAGQGWDSTGSAPSSGYGGGGGAGRKSGTGNTRGQGGGAGGTAAGYVTDLTPGQAIAVTVGAGGTCGGTYTGGAGRAGAVYVWW